MNQEQRINEVAGKVMDLLDSHEMDADIIILALKVRNRGERVALPPWPNGDPVAPIESVLAASGLEPGVIDCMLNRIYRTYMDC